MSAKRFRMEPSRLSAALVAALVMPLAGTAFAQDASTTTDQTTTTTDKKAETLDKVIVTGSLIPQTTLETAKPVLVISAEDLKTRGYTNVQDALPVSVQHWLDRIGLGDLNSLRTRVVDLLKEASQYDLLDRENPSIGQALAAYRNGGEV